MSDHRSSLARVDAGVRHGPNGQTQPTTSTAGSSASCAKCGSGLSNRSRRPKSGARFCSQRCRFAATRERRAAARRDLLDALIQLTEVEARIRRALSTLGLNPKKPRKRHKEKSDG